MMRNGYERHYAKEVSDQKYQRGDSKGKRNIPSIMKQLLMITKRDGLWKEQFPGLEHREGYL
jgi:hypothetical protein